MCEKFIAEIEQKKTDYYMAIRDYEYLRALDVDHEFKQTEEQISELIDKEKIISTMMDNYMCEDVIGDNEQINNFFQFYTNYRRQEEMMEYKMYMRGFKDCIELLKEAKIL